MSQFASDLVGFFEDMIPNFKRNQLVDDVSSTLTSIEQNVKPMYDLDLALNVTGELSQSLTTAFNKKVSGHRGSVYDGIAHTVSQISENADDILDMVEGAFSKKVYKESLDYYAINVLRYIDALNYFAEYATAFVTGVVSEELKNQREIIQGPTDRTSYEFASNHLNMDSFIVVTNILNMDVKDYVKKIKDLKGYIFEAEEYGAVKAANGRKLDPMAYGFTSVNFNPFFHVIKFIDVIRHNQNQARQHTLIRLQLQLEAMKVLREENPDSAELEKLSDRIDYYENRINKLQGKIEAYEGA